MSEKDIKQYIDNMIWHISTNTEVLGEKKNVRGHTCSTKEYTKIINKR